MPQDDTQFEGPSYTKEEIESGLPEHDSLLEQAKAVGEGALQGALGPVGTATAIGYGSDPEMMRERASAFPITHSLSEMGGFAGSAIASEGIAPLVGRAGKAIETASGFGKVGGTALKLGTELGLLSAGDEVSKLIQNDPDQSLGSAIAHVGASTALGLGGGAFLGKAALGLDKSKQFLEDFKGRLGFHLKNPEPVDALTRELQDHYNNITSMADDVYGPSGLKAEDISKAVPTEMTSKIVDQANILHDDVENIISKAETEPGIYGGQKLNALKEYHARLNKALSGEASDANAVYNALNDFKKDIGPLKNWKRAPDVEKPISKLIGGVYEDVRTALEDTDVWGKAGERQQAINKAFHEFLPALKDFEKTFTSKIGEEALVDPNKIKTFLNGVGKSNAEIKQTKLSNFLDASEKYKEVVDASHQNLGLSPPEWHNPLNMARASTEEVSPGAKLADVLVNRGMAKFGGRALGAAAGASVGSLFGSKGFGAIIGEHTLGPLLESVLPALTKPILESASNAEGLKSAIDYSMAVAKGEKLLKSSVENIFKATGPAIPEKVVPTDKTMERFERGLKAAQNDPSILLRQDSSLAHYMPDHASTVAAASANLMTLLKSLRPNTSPQGPLEDDRVPNKVEDAQYTKALMIAEQPAVLLNKIKDGTLTADEVVLAKQLHPGFVANVQQKLVTELADQVAKGETIPYKVRISVSRFLGQPLDASLKPGNIIANQMLKIPGHEPQQQEASGKGTSKTGQQKSALQKLSGMYNTPIQAREQKKLA